MTGSTAALRRSSRLILGDTPRFIVAAVSLVGEDARDGVADERLHVRDHGFQGVAIIWIAGQRLHMGDELAALGVADRGGDGDLTPNS